LAFQEGASPRHRFHDDGARTSDRLVVPLIEVNATPSPILRQDRTSASYSAALGWAGDRVSRLKLVAAACSHKPGCVWVRLANLRQRKKGV
jgi:hypothetical protein